MLRKLTCLATVFLFTFTAYTQLPSWETHYPVPHFEFQPFGVILENDNSFFSINGSVFAEICHYGIARNKFFLPSGPVSNPFFHQYFFFEQVDAPGNAFYLAANRVSVVSNEINLHTIFPDGTTGITEYQLDDNLQNHLKKGPTAVKTNDGDFVIFGNENYNKVRVEDAQTINTLWTKPGNFGLIADADNYNDGFILCNEDGYLIHLDENGETVWSENFGYRFMAVETLNDGFIVCGEVDGESALIKTDFSGNILWQKTYGDSLAFDVVATSDGGFAFTGTSEDLQVFVVKTDASGDEIWHRYFGNGKGAKILESIYGGFLIQGRDGGEAILKRIDDNGFSGDNIPFQVNGPQSLQANNISAIASSGGKHFGSSDYQFQYNFPKGAETSTYFSGGLWMAGLDDAGDLHYAGSSYTSNNSSSVYQGGYIGANPDTWTNEWSVDRDMIKIFRDDIADGIKDLPWFDDIITWPGKGNPNYFFDGEQVEILVDMAPFVDVNGDGIYNVFDGDYPEIKGDQMLWWVMNDETDRTDNQGNQSSIPVGVQVFCSFYSVGCVDNDLVNNSTFLEFDIQNLSQNDYSEFYLGWFSNFFIGCYDDDYTGSIPDVNAVYVYNADDEDGESGGCSLDNLTRFTDEAPIQTVSFLNQDADVFMTFNNGGFSPPPFPGTDDPSSAQDHYNILQAIFTDGVHLSEGGNGHQYPVVDTTKIAFPGNPALNTGWSGCAESLDLQNRRMIISKGPMILQAGEQLSLKIALLTLTDIPQPCPDSDLITARITELQDIFNNADFTYTLDLGPDLKIEEGENVTLEAGVGGTSYLWSTGEMTSSIDVSTFGVYSVTVTTSWGCELVDEISVDNVNSNAEIELSTLKVYPNPTNGQLFIELENEIPEKIYLESLMGRRLKSFDVPHGSSNTTLELNIPDTTPGVYFLRFDFKYKEAIQKLVIMK